VPLEPAQSLEGPGVAAADNCEIDDEGDVVAVED
jgi:hypothetical protein